MKYFLSWWEGYLYWQKPSLNQGYITSLKYTSNITDFLGFYLKCSSQSHSHTYLFILSLFPSLHFSLYFSHSSLNRGSLAHFHLKHNLISFSSDVRQSKECVLHELCIKSFNLSLYQNTSLVNEELQGWTLANLLMTPQKTCPTVEMMPKTNPKKLLIPSLSSYQPFAQFFREQCSNNFLRTFAP